MRIPPAVKRQLKKPLGRLYKSLQKLKTLSRYRIISIGDVCTLALLDIGIRPHLAIFDHRFMRRKLGPEGIGTLSRHFKRPKKYKNPPGMLSEAIVKDAKRLIAKGGAVLIDGEEDLTALAFIRSATAKDLVLYGQPHKGIVLVRPNKKIKRRIESWLSYAKENDY
ncbi:MAG: DUF359 domain-containing protein [Candidatus ainarchaeum sp.]|nr:DUF359 domain-containing protein [Candidatus ainarchaeum sp.]